MSDQNTAPGSLAEYVSGKLAVIAGDAARQDRRAARLDWSSEVQQTFTRFHVVDLLEELRERYWGSGVIEFLQSPIPCISIRRLVTKYDYDQVEAGGNLYRGVMAEITRTMTVQAVEPAYRIFGLRMAAGEQAATGEAIGSGSPTEAAYTNLVYLTERVLAREDPSELDKLLEPRAPRQVIGDNGGCDLFFSYHEKSVDGPGVPPPVQVTVRDHLLDKPTRILAGSVPTLLRDVIGKQLVAELILHDRALTGTMGPDMT